MRLTEYFDIVRAQTLSNAQKNTIYARVLSKTQGGSSEAREIGQVVSRGSIFSRARFYVKVAGYTLFLGALGLSVYLPYMGSQEAAQPSSLAVRADYIAKVVKTEGEYYIQSADARLHSDSIANGDTLVLAEHSSLVVHVGDHVQGKIIGPAKVIVQRQEQGYAITLQEGDYIEMSALGDETLTPQIALVSVDHKMTARTDAGKGFHFVLTQENNQPLLVNKSDETIEITNNEENSTQDTLLLAQEQSATMPNDTIIITKNQSAQTLALALEKTQTEGQTVQGTFDEGFFKKLLLQESEQKDTMTPLATDAATLLAVTDETATKTEKNVDKKQVRANLIPQFVRVDVKYITYYYLNGQNHEYHVAYDNYLKRLDNLYGAMGIDMPESIKVSLQEEAYDIQTLITLTTYLRQHVPAEIPTHQANTIGTLVTFLQKVDTQLFGSYKGQGLTVEEMFAKLQ